MPPVFKLTLTACLIASLAACSSDSDSTDGSTVDDAAGGVTVGSGSGENGSNDGSTDNPTGGTDGGTDGGTTGGTTGDQTDGAASGTSDDPTNLDDLPDPVIPELDPTAQVIPAPDPADPFGSALDIDPEAAVAGGPPTQPKNLRADLIANDWSIINWAPANDDTEVVEYRINRSDGHTYVMRGDLNIDNELAQLELDKDWATTAFMDCNYTRFTGRVYNCETFGPEPGDTFTYTVIAVDDEGNESAPSEPLTITYQLDQNAPVPLYNDRFLDTTGFVQNHDLSNTAYFLDEFELVFEDDFDGDTIDENRWNTELVFGDDTIINSEQQYFVDIQDDPDFGYNPFTLEDSILTIEAIPTPAGLVSKLPEACSTINEAKPPCQFLSGALATQDKFNMTFGYVEGRMKTGDISGALSSFYLFHRFPGEALERHGPEIDIIEYLGENPFGDEDAFQTYHYEDVNTGLIRSSPTMIHENEDGTLYSDEFHTYGVLWEPQLMIWYIDGEEIKRISGPQTAARAMNIVTYLVAGSGWAPTPDADGVFPLTYQIDYIRAYQRNSYIGNGLYPSDSE